MNTSQISHKKAHNNLIHFEDVFYQTSDRQFELSINSFDVSEGEKVAITGASGSGKTTLLSLISGYKEAKRGTLNVLGTKLHQTEHQDHEQLRLQHMGIIFQDFRLINYLTIRDNISLTTFLSPVDVNLNVHERVDDIANQLQLRSLLNRFPHQLSQGERQRTAIGRAIFQKPKLILADEPTGNLDPQTAQRTLDFLFQVIESTQATLVMITHDHSVLPRYTNHMSMTDLLCTAQHENSV